jgi:hypothetical protein
MYHLFPDVSNQITQLKRMQLGEVPHNLGHKSHLEKKEGYKKIRILYDDK